MECWLRRQAIQIAAQLPEKPEEALEVLELAQKIVRDFLTPPQPSVGRSGTVLSLPVRDKRPASGPGE
jgi:hypothetical protein